ncbi:MAG: antitoxin [Actinomycetota bacterium]|nr:antitoxin [Actinomycetota bacterium]
MRTTVTLDDDTEALVRNRLRERGVSFKQALNDAIRQGLAPRKGGDRPFRTETADLGLPGVNLDRALALAGELEDEELVRRSRAGK